MDYVRTMANAERVPWHGKGHVEKSFMTGGRILKVSGTNWNTSKRPLYAYIKETDEYLEVPTSMQTALVRDGEWEVMDTVGSKYWPLQNQMMVEFLKTFFDVSGAHFASGGVLDTPRGVFVWYCMRMPKGFKIGGLNEEKHDVYVTFIDKKGSGAAEIFASATRVVCDNTARLARRSAPIVFKIVHLKSAEGRLQQAREALQVTVDEKDGYVATCEALLAKKATAKTVENVFASIWPQPAEKASDKVWATWNNRLDQVKAVWKESPNLDTVRRTHYGVFNAFTEWAQWGRSFRGSGGDVDVNNAFRTEEILLGQTREIGQKAWAALVK